MFSRCRDRRVSLACIGTAIVASSFTSGCAMFRDDFTVRVDSITVTPLAPTGTYFVRVYGWGNNGCAELRRVERSTRGDTLFRRLVGANSGGLCPQKEVVLPYDEQVTVPVGRALSYTVQQPDGSRIGRILPAP